MGFTGSPPVKTHLGSGVPLPNDGSRHHPGTAPPRSDVNAEKGSNPSPSALTCNGFHRLPAGENPSRFGCAPPERRLPSPPRDGTTTERRQRGEGFKSLSLRSDLQWVSPAPRRRKPISVRVCPSRTTAPVTTPGRHHHGAAPTRRRVQIPLPPLARLRRGFRLPAGAGSGQ